MLGRENVGGAFIALHATGDEVPKDIADALDKLTPAMQEAGKKHAKVYNEEWRKQHGVEFDKLIDQFSKSASGFADRQFTPELNAIRKVMVQLGDDMRLNDRLQESWLRRFSHNLGEVNARLDVAADNTARMFGKGSRNDLINFVGSAVGGVQRLINLLPKGVELMTKFFSGEGSGINWANAGKSIASTLFGVAVAVTAVSVAAGPLAALVVGLSAAVIALVGSLTFALGAVGGVALALSGPLVAGIGIGIAAFRNLDAETKAIADRIGDRFVDLGDVAGEAIGGKLRKALETVEPQIDGLEPLVRRVSRAIGDVALSFAEVTTSAAYRAFLQDFTEFAPNAIESLGTSAANATEGMLGMFRGTIPLAEDFLGWLEDITQQFADWANSPQGQQELLAFFEKAGDSAETVGDFLAAATDALTTLLDKGRNSGDSLFESMTRSLEDLTAWLNDPANQAAIIEFFEDGEQVARDLGNTIEGVGRALGRMSDSNTVAALGAVLAALEGIVTVISVYVSTTYTAVDGLIGGFRNLGRWIDNTVDAGADAFDRLGRAIEDALPEINLADLVNGRGLAPAVITPFQGLAGRAVRAIGTVSLRDIVRAGGLVASITSPFAGLASRALRSLGTFQLRDIVRAVGIVSAITSPFRGLAARALSALGTFALSEIVDAAGVVDAVVDPFRGLASDVLGAIGTIDLGSLIRFPRDLPGVPGMARGGISDTPRHVIFGEAGREALVPLDRPLHQVDPSVRDLAAYAQGRGGGINVEAGAIVVNEAVDGRSTAREVLNDIVTFAY